MSELLRSRRQASTLSPANFTVETRPGTFRRAAFPPSTLPSTFALFPTPTFPTNAVPSNWENFQGHSMERRISNVITDRFLLVCLGIDPGYLAPRRYQWVFRNRKRALLTPECLRTKRFSRVDYWRRLIPLQRIGRRNYKSLQKYSLEIFAVRWEERSFIELFSNKIEMRKRREKTNVSSSYD